MSGQPDVDSGEAGARPALSRNCIVAWELVPRGGARSPARAASDALRAKGGGRCRADRRLDADATHRRTSSARSHLRAGFVFFLTCWACRG